MRCCLLRGRAKLISAHMRPLNMMASMPSGPLPKVVVVGAGFAGLSAAKTLQLSQKVDVLVLEASQRVGGRAWTKPLPGTSGDALSMELGATWLHGLGTAEDPNPLFREAVRHGIMEQDPKATEWWESEWLLPGATEPLSREQALAVHKVVKDFAEAVDELDPSMTGSLAQQLESVRAEAIGAAGAEHAELAQRAWRWREMLQRAIDGSHTSGHISAEGLALYDDMEGPFAEIPGPGYQGLAEAMAGGLDIRFGQEVERIEYGVGPLGVRVTCKGGAVYEGAAAVVTVSLGVLKARHTFMFQPPLPARTVEAIQRLQIGVVDKIFVNLSPPSGSLLGTGGTSASPAVGGSQPAGGGAAATQEAEETEAAEGEQEVVSYALLWDAGSDAAASEELPPWARGIFAIRFGGPELKQLQPSSARLMAEAEQPGQQVPQPPEQQVPGQGPPSQQQQQQQQQQQHNTAGAAAAADPQQLPAAAGGQQPVAVPWAVMWVSGEDALAMERATDEEVLATVRAIVRSFPGMRRLPAGWVLDEQGEGGSAAGSVVRSKWGLDPLFRGSYSYLGVESRPEDVEALLNPIWAPAAGEAAGEKLAGGSSGRGSGRGSSNGTDSAGGSSSGEVEGEGSAAGAGSMTWPMVLLCGEACHVRYIGCAHAAYFTGQQQAHLLLKHLAGQS